jgi:hypothetical protein
MSVNAAVRGSIRAELRNPLGAALPGYELHRCEPVTGDSGRLIFRWGDGEMETSSLYQYDAVSVYLELDDAVLYSVSL